MKPIAFAQANKDLQPSGHQYSDDVTEVVPLPVYTNGEQCISCWRLSFWERVQLPIGFGLTQKHILALR